MLKHGQAKKYNQTRFYKKWAYMKSRCLNPNNISYARYGGKGVKVCDRWLDFKNFLEDMGDSFSDGLSLDRIDNNKGYSKENCRWVKPEFQMKNKITVKPIKYKGQTLNSAEWDKLKGFNRGTIWHRLSLGWSIEKAIETPLKIKSKNKRPRIIKPRKS